MEQTYEMRTRSLAALEQEKGVYQLLTTFFFLLISMDENVVIKNVKSNI